MRLDEERLLGTNHVAYCGLIRRSMWDSLGGHRTGLPLTCDWDFWKRAVKAGYRHEGVSAPLLWYRKHPDSMTAKRRNRDRS